LLKYYVQIIAYVKMFMTKLLTVSHDYSHIGTPLKHEKEDDESYVDLTMFDTEDDKSSIDLAMFDIDDDMSSDLDDCCHHNEKVGTSIQMFSIFITSIIITN
jgi:hypothetical protein